MKDLNEVFIVGRAVDDVNIFNYNGRIKYKMVIAINYYSYNKKKVYSDFVPVSVWKDEEKDNTKLNGLNKGDTVVVKGRVSVESYEKNDEHKVAFEIIGTNIKYFKLNKDSNDLENLVEIIKANKELLEAILNSSEFEISEQLMQRLRAEKAN